MIYRSNLVCPVLSPHFKHLTCRVMGHSFGHEVLSDWADKADDDPVFGIYKRCGFWTHDEVAILYNVAKQMGGTWLDIGAHTGWTTAHLAAATTVAAVDPMLRYAGFSDRFEENCNHCWSNIVDVSWLTSREFFRRDVAIYSGVVIDGDHEPPNPIRDAQQASECLGNTGVIMLHDGVGRPVREAVEWLLNQGFHARAYYTPHLVFCCWRGNFTPPDHTPDPAVRAQLTDGRFDDLDFERCE